MRITFYFIYSPCKLELIQYSEFYRKFSNLKHLLVVCGLGVQTGMYTVCDGMVPSLLDHKIGYIVCHVDSNYV